MPSELEPIILPPIPVAASRSITFDFKQFVELQSPPTGGGLTISSATVTATPSTGLTLGAAVVSGTLVQTRKSAGGTAGTYLLTITAVTSGGDSLVGYALLDHCGAPAPE